MCVSCLWGNSFILELTFEYDGTQTENLKPDASAACSIDLGLNNFATMISTKAEVPFLLVKGGKVKSINPWRNKQVAELKSLGKPGHTLPQNPAVATLGWKTTFTRRVAL